MEQPGAAMDADSDEGSASETWSRARRLQFIDFRLQWDGRLNRTDLVNFFSISVPQASKDIGRYLQLCPQNMVYDRSSKAYVVLPSFKAHYETSGPRQYLAQLLGVTQGVVQSERSFFGFEPPARTVPMPQRAVDEAILKQLLRAVGERGTLRVEYQPITSDDHSEREISPHAFVHDGRRWHVRAYCHLLNRFRDFVIGRILTIHASTASSIDPATDLAWHTEVELVLVPHPKLSDRQRHAVEVDFKMVDGRVSMRCPQAMLYYTLRQLDLEDDGSPRDYPRQICLANLDEIRPILAQLAASHR